MNLPVKLLSAASAVAILIAADTSSAETTKKFQQISFTDQTQTEQSSEVRTENRTRAEMGMTGQRDGEDNILEHAGDEMREGMENIKAAFGADTSATLNVNTLASAERLIGQTIYNAQMERVGSVEDLVLDRQGEIQQLVISDGGFLDIGDKEAAFSFEQLNPRYVNNRLQMNLTEAMLEQARHFSTDRADAAPDTDVIQNDYLTASKLIDADLVGPDNDVLAQVENITFGPRGDTSKLIITYGSFFGFGGDRAAMNFSDVRLVEDEDGDLRFELTANQAAQLNRMKERN